jgi:putative DNA primase/helicase
MVPRSGSVAWSPGLINSTVRTANDIPDLRFIILDPVAMFRAGDENANKDATKFVEAMEMIRNETGVTVLCAHHSRKCGTGESAEDIRGASAFVDALRFAATLHSRSAEDAKKLGISEGEHRSWVRIMVVRSNNKTDVDEQWYRRAEEGVLALTAAPKGKGSAIDNKVEERYLAALPKLK